MRGKSVDQLIAEFMPKKEDSELSKIDSGKLATGAEPWLVICIGYNMI